MFTTISRRAGRSLLPVRAAGVGAMLAMLGGCGQAPDSFGAAPEAGRANADEMLGAFATRFTNAKRMGMLEHTHNQMVRHALFPSRLFEDTTLWSLPRRGDTRTLAVYGTMVGAQYHLAPRAAPIPPARAGDIRIITNLARVGESEYKWFAVADLALGTLSAADFIRGVRASLTELENRSEPATRTEYRASLPRTTAALGTLFTLDTIRSTRRDDGSVSHFAAITIHPDRARKTYPTFGKFLDEYVSPARYRLTVVDRGGAIWMMVDAGKDLLTIRARTRDGALLPLLGPARALPDTLVLRADLSLHVLFFDVGMTDLIGDMTIVDDPHEAGFAIHFQREPNWHFPLATNRLIKTPLRRPFAAEGSLFRLTVRDSAGAQTVISRQVGTAVQESGILRWLARLNRTAADDYTISADVERNRFLVDVFGALRDDVRAPRAVPTKSDGGY